MRRSGGALVVTALTLVAASAGAATAPTPSGTWAGTFRIPQNRAAVPMSVALRGGDAVVTIGAGHPAETVVRARRTPGRLRFSLPGRPAGLAFDGVLRAQVIRGTVRQGAVRGTFVLRRGARGDLWIPGLYTLPGGRHLVVADGFFGRNAVELDVGELHLLSRTAPGRYTIGAGVGDPMSVGTAAFEASTATWTLSGRPEERAMRVPWRQEEVRVTTGSATLGCTLTIPPGDGPRPAAAFAHGSGPAFRYYVATWSSFFASAGMVTLACDKRGIGQSGGTYPGEAASTANIDQYARDLEAQARFLAAQPEVDDARIGVSGASQAGWIMPLAASREPAIRWLVLLVSPTVTQGESDLWGDLTLQGERPPPRSLDAIEAEVRRAGPGGFDPMPAIRSLRIPALWLYGAIDLHVPTRLSVERLEPVTREPGRDFAYVVFPRGAHALIDTATGLNADVRRSSRYVAGLFTTIRDWLRSRQISAGAQLDARARTPRPPCLRASDGARVLQFRAADRTRLLAVRMGRGTTGVVLAHRWRGSLCSWLSYARVLKARGLRVLAFDFRGHGLSGHPLYPRAEYLQRDVVAAARVLRSLGATKIVLAGESMGGTTVLHAAATMTPQPAAVVSLSAPTIFGRVNGIQALRRLRIPVLLVAGEDDDGFADEARQLLAAAEPSTTRLEVVPGGAHGADMLRSAPVRDLVTAFIAHPSA